MGLIEKTIEVIIALFIIVLFATTVFPALGEATGQDTTFIIIVLAILFGAIIIAFLRGILR